MLFENFNHTKNGYCAGVALSLLGLIAIVLLNGCSADYDTLGVSDYRNLEEISFAGRKYRYESFCITLFG